MIRKSSICGCRVLGRDRHSVPGILERIASRYEVDRLLISMDPISLRIAENMKLGRLRKTYFLGLDECFVKALSMSENFMVVVFADGSNYLALFNIVRKIAHILEQNGDTKSMIFIASSNKEVFNRLISLAYASHLRVVVPPDFSTIAVAGSVLFGKGGLSYLIVISEPEIVNLETFEEEFDFDSIEKSFSYPDMDLNLNFGGGKVAIVGLGCVLGSILDVVNRANLRRDLTVYGVVHIDENLDKYLEGIILKHNNIILVGPDLLAGILKNKAQKLIEDGKLRRIPSIIAIEKNYSNIGPLSMDALENFIKSFLGRGTKAEVEHVEIDSEVRLYYGEKVSDIISGLMKSIKKLRIMVVRPLEADISTVDYVDDLFDVYAIVAKNKGELTNVVVCHISKIMEMLDILKAIVNLEAKNICIVSTLGVPEKVFRAISKEISEVLGPKVGVVEEDFEENIPKMAKKINNILVYV